MHYLFVRKIFQKSIVDLKINIGPIHQIATLEQHYLLTQIQQITLLVNRLDLERTSDLLLSVVGMLQLPELESTQGNRQTVKTKQLFLFLTALNL